jgi:hypothetical protein
MLSSASIIKYAGVRESASNRDNFLNYFYLPISTGVSEWDTYLKKLDKSGRKIYAQVGA